MTTVPDIHILHIQMIYIYIQYILGPGWGLFVRGFLSMDFGVPRMIYILDDSVARKDGREDMKMTDDE